MRRIAVGVIVALLAFALVGCASGLSPSESTQGEEAEVGAWTPNTDMAEAFLTDGQRLLFDEVMTDTPGASYEPIGVLGQQPASGTNYAYLCKATSTVDSSVGEWDVVVLNLDPDDNGSFVCSNTLDPANVKTTGTVFSDAGGTTTEAQPQAADGETGASVNADQESDIYYDEILGVYVDAVTGEFVDESAVEAADGTGTDAVDSMSGESSDQAVNTEGYYYDATVGAYIDPMTGVYIYPEVDQEAEASASGWMVTAAYGGVALPGEADAAFKSAMYKLSESEDGYVLAPQALLATQVVSGTNYQVLCVGAPIEPADAPFAVYNVVVYQDLDGNSQITSMETVDFDYYVTEH